MIQQSFLQRVQAMELAITLLFNQAMHQYKELYDLKVGHQYTYRDERHDYLDCWPNVWVTSNCAKNLPSGTYDKLLRWTFGSCSVLRVTFQKIFKDEKAETKWQIHWLWLMSTHSKPWRYNEK